MKKTSVKRRALAQSANTDPIVTIKLRRVTQQGNIGDDPDITLQVQGGPLEKSISMGASPRVERWLFQASSASSSFPVAIKITIEDTTVVFHEAKIISVNQTPPNTSNGYDPRFGTQSVVIDVSANGAGGVTNRATFTFEFDWFVTPSAAAVADFIINQASTNLQSGTFQTLQAGLSAVPTTTRRDRGLLLLRAFTVPPNSGAYWVWLNQVKNNGPWDYKLDIRLPSTEPAPTGHQGHGFGNWSLVPGTKVRPPFTFWANFHFGYVGAAAGFPEDDLLEGAGAARAKTEQHLSVLDVILPALLKGTAKAFDQPEDQAAIRLGFRMFLNGPLTTAALLRAITRDPNLANSDAPEGEPPSRFWQQ